MYKEQLDYFSLVYQTRNFSSAAKLIPMSPQGLAKAIHSLENELGVVLFKDENGALIPTAYAEEFLRFANRWDVNYQLMKESFRRLDAQEKHEIRLGTSLGILGFVGHDFIKQFHHEHPHIQIIYNESNDIYCEEGLHRGTYDLAFTLAPYDRQFITAELYSTKVLFWVNKKKFSELGKQLTIEDFAGKNISLPGKDFKIYQTITELCKMKGIQLGEIFASGEIFWLYEHAVKGKGFSFTLPHLEKLSVFSTNQEVVALPLKGITWRFGISYLASHTLLPHEKDFIDYCIEKAKLLK